MTARLSIPSARANPCGEPACSTVEKPAIQRFLVEPQVRGNVERCSAVFEPQRQDQTSPAGSSPDISRFQRARTRSAIARPLLLRNDDLSTGAFGNGICDSASSDSNGGGGGRAIGRQSRRAPARRPGTS